MYIESLEVENFRCFEKARVLFEFDGRHRPAGAPRLPNVNLILGDNGTGKSAILRGIILAVLGPIIQSTGFRPYMLVRRTGNRDQQDNIKSQVSRKANLFAGIRLHPQDAPEPPIGWSQEATGTTSARTSVERRGSIETISALQQSNSKKWEPLFEDLAPAFFLTAYGANRRVDSPETFDTGSRDRTRAPRYQRVAGLFEEAAPLTPVNVWWNELLDRERLAEGIELLNALLPEGVHVTDEILRISIGVGKSKGQTTSYIEFSMRGTALPFSALSDGYRGFIGWVVDLLYQMSQVTPTEHKLTDLCGVVIVDELDLLLHPAWQRTVIETLATTFPRLQFFFTSHSPIIAGTLEAANLIVTEVDEETGQVKIDKSRERVYGLSADQVLGSRYFGLTSSRAQGAQRQLRELAKRAMQDDNAAEEYLRLLTNGDDGTAEKAPRNGKRQAR